jgi:hypothetical protein
VDRAFGLAEEVEAMVRESAGADGAFALAAPASCANVGFWYGSAQFAKTVLQYICQSSLFASKATLYGV